MYRSFWRSVCVTHSHGSAPALAAEGVDDAFRKLTRPDGAGLVVRNRALHRLLVDGVTVEYRDSDGSIRGAQARAIDFDGPTDNDWLAVNQFSVVEHKHSRSAGRGAVRERPSAGGAQTQESPTAENATLSSAFQQLQAYQAEGPDAVRTERAARRFRWVVCARGHARRRARVVQALVHLRGRYAGQGLRSRASGSTKVTNTGEADIPRGEVLVYEAPDGAARVDVRLERDTVWLRQEQMSQLFGRERSVITKHVRNVFQEGELDP
jgi:hypothetical protein